MTKQSKAKFIHDIAQVAFERAVHEYGLGDLDDEEVDRKFAEASATWTAAHNEYLKSIKK